MNRGTTTSFTSCEEAQEDAGSETRREASGNRPCRRPDLKRPGSKPWENKFLSFKPSNLRYFVTAAQANEDRRYNRDPCCTVNQSEAEKVEVTCSGSPEGRTPTQVCTAPKSTFFTLALGHLKEALDRLAECRFLPMEEYRACTRKAVIRRDDGEKEEEVSTSKEASSEEGSLIGRNSLETEVSQPLPLGRMLLSMTQSSGLRLVGWPHFRVFSVAWGMNLPSLLQLQMQVRARGFNSSGMFLKLSNTL